MATEPNNILSWTLGVTLLFFALPAYGAPSQPREGSAETKPQETVSAPSSPEPRRAPSEEKRKARTTKDTSSKDSREGKKKPPPMVAPLVPSVTPSSPARSRPRARARSRPVYESVVRAKVSKARDPTGENEQVDGERLRNTTRGSTLEALSQESAGVYVPGRGALHGVASGATGGIHIRGLGGSPNSQVLVVEDTVPDYMGIFGHPIPDAYVPFLIDDAVVIKGGDSVLYGTNAMGGVVVLHNRWRTKPGFEMENDSAYGSFSTIRETASVLGRVGKLDVAGAFHTVSTDGHRMGAGGDLMVGYAAARYLITPHLRLGVRNKVVHLQGADPGPVTHPHAGHWFDVWRNNSALRLELKRRNFRLKVTPFFNLGVHRLYDGFYSHDYVTGGIAEAKMKPHRQVKILLGLSGQHVDGLVENRVDGQRSPVEGLTDFSAYSQVTYRPVDSLSLVAGARTLYSLTYGTIFLYKGGFRWNLYKGLYARSRVVRNFRQPTIRELYLPFPTANPDLKPETSLNWDFALEYVARYFKVSATGYRTQAKNLIRYFGAWPTAEVVNIDGVVFWGVEGRVELRRMGPVSARLSGDWKEVGRYTRQNPEAKLDFTVEAKHSFGCHYVAGSLSGEWVHGLYMSNYGRDPIDDAFAMDLALRYRYTSARRGFSLEPYVFVRNFLDRRYAFVEGYPMPGINVLVGLKARL